MRVKLFLIYTYARMHVIKMNISWKRINIYLNPIKRLGYPRYSIMFPIALTVFIYALLEFIVYFIIRDPNAVGYPAIVLSIILIVYLAFRDGILGGVIVATITIAYYLFIVYTRHYSGNQLKTSVITIAILGVVYFLIAGLIGWLKETIDGLIEKQLNEKKRLKAILQELPVGVVVADDDGKLVQANKQAEYFAGGKIGSNLTIGKDLFINIMQNGKAVHTSVAPLTLALKGKTTLKKEFEIKNENKEFVVSITSSPIRNKNGKIIAAASIINDITAQKELEKRKDDFISMASHELKTPLTSMSLYLSVLKARVGKSDLKTLKILNSVQNQTLRLSELVNDLLDVSKIQTGKLNFNYEVFRIDELALEVVTDLQNTTTQSIVLSKSSRTLVYGDKFRIYQVLTNLITNAIKYSSDKILVKITKDKNDVTLSVKDFGIGISIEQKNKIFDKLYQVTGNNEKTYPGLGMGLYISKEIIKRHHGKIWVESKKGSGSTFYFSLPVKNKAL